MFLAKTYGMSVKSCPLPRPKTHLAELDTHLIVRVDAPDGALHVNFVLCTASVPW